MSKTGLIQCIGVLSVLGFVDIEASAEPMLLVEIRQNGFARRNAIGDPLLMGLVTQVTDNTTRSFLGGTYDSSDVGTTLEASPQVLAGIEAAFHAPSGSFLIETGVAVGANDVDFIWSMAPPMNWTITRHVPRLGHGLTGYDLTRATHTVDHLGYIQSGREIYADHAQTIRFYGMAVPEPSTFVVFLAGYTLFSIQRRSLASVPVRSPR